ncbi:TauD/TfdA family dioxygenase [Stenotrophomonas maltophilia]|nr:TauD/TfdA family dioxygenase [Stenotrophomonas maltophilia]MBN5133921.1 TauD/TfdA family dioxygenase [Stenotrophomonas maltophilia]
MQSEPLNVLDMDVDAARARVLALLDEGTIDLEDLPTPPGHPLSDAQHRMWLADAAGGQSAMFNFPTVMALQGRMGVDVLRRDFQTVLRRHHVLTASFRDIDGEPRQVFDPQIVLRLPVVDLSGLPPAARDAQRQALIDADGDQVFDLARGPLLRLTLVRSDTEQAHLLMSVHHIISDGWSSTIMTRELIELLQAGIQQRPAVLPDVTVQYSDYVYWQQAVLEEAVAGDMLDYWRRRLAGSTTLRLPLDRPRTARRRMQGETVIRPLPEATLRLLQRVRLEHRHTMFSLLLATFNVLLSRYSDSEDICVGTSVAHRPLPELESLIGLFVNQVVLRSQVSPQMSFDALVAQVAETTVGALANRDIPFERVVAECPHQREAGTAPLFQVLFLHNNQPRQAMEGAGALDVTPVAVANKVARFDLTLMMSESDDSIDAEWTFRSDIFERSTIETMAARYEHMLLRLLQETGRAIGDVGLYTDEETTTRRGEMDERVESRARKFVAGRRRGISLGGIAMVDERPMQQEVGYPLLMTPAREGVDLAEWAGSDPGGIEARLHRHGSILFRGFGVSSAERFERFASAVCPNLNGEYGDLPKEVQGERVYKSTPYPEDKAILFHNEGSHTHCWPMKQFFSCQIVAPQGGETPIVDCRDMFRRLSRPLTRRFAERGLLYVRNFVEGLDVSWQDFFRTDDRQALGRRLDALGIQHEWTGANNLRTRQAGPAVACHPRTGDWVFFNQLQLHHVGYLAAEERAALLELFDEQDLPRNVYYGDGQPIEDDVIAEVGALYDAMSISFPWESGDVLMVDNMLVAHGRHPFSGPRKVIVAMGEMLAASELPRPPYPFD